MNVVLNDKYDWYRFCLDDKSDDTSVHEFVDIVENSDTNAKHKTVDIFPDRGEFDAYIGAQVVLPSKDGESIVLTNVTSRKYDNNGKVIGEGNNNPILDTRIYQVEYPDGAVAE